LSKLRYVVARDRSLADTLLAESVAADTLKSCFSQKEAVASQLEKRPAAYRSARS
jgi:hypothetical protein